MIRLALRITSCAFVLLVAACGESFEAGPATIKDAWVSATRPGQTAAAGYFTIVSSEAAKVAEVSSPLAQATEIHKMSMVDGIMRMEPVGELILPANATVKLEPGALHLMIMGLNQPLAAGQKLPLRVVVTDSRGARHEINVTATVRDRDESHH